MSQDLNKRRDLIVETALKHVAFDGWSNRALIQGARDYGFPDNMVRRVFPNGMSEVVDHFADWSDRRMVKPLNGQNLDSMKIDCENICWSDAIPGNFLDSFPGDSQKLFQDGRGGHTDGRTEGTDRRDGRKFKRREGHD